MSTEFALELAIGWKKKKDKVGENRTNAMLHRGTISSGRPIIINDKIWRMRRRKKIQNFFLRMQFRYDINVKLYGIFFPTSVNDEWYFY